MGTTNCCLDRKAESTLRNFGNLLTSSASGGRSLAMQWYMYLLRDKTCYQDLGPDYFDRLNPEGLRRRLTKRLEGLGFKVTVEPLAQVT
jgi:hypothetical protein